MNTTSKLLLSRVLLLLTFGWSTAFSVNNIVEPKTFSPNVKNHGIVSSAFASAAVPAAALAAVEDGVELAELPPPIVPIIFAIGLIVGVGLLTSSLGDVYSEGTNTKLEY